MLSFVGSTVFECEQLVVSWKHVKVCRILLQVQKIRFLSHVLGCTAAGFARRRAAGLLPAPS